MTLYQILTDPDHGVGIPVAYSHFKSGSAPESPPYLVYIGNGQNTRPADNTLYWRRNRYQLEYYFAQKDEAQEAAIEDALLNNGIVFEKSEDVYIEDEDVYMIYYYI